jgi:hypothetical protein
MRISLLVVALAACGPKAAARDPRPVDFKCNGRSASYNAVGTLMYQQVDITLSCERDLPKVVQTFLSDEGTEQVRSGVIPVSSWEQSWSNFTNAGWRNLQDCVNPSAGAREPLYTFSVADSDYQNTFTCQGNSLPFPYDTLLQALDSAAGELPGE